MGTLIIFRDNTILSFKFLVTCWGVDSSSGNFIMFHWTVFTGSHSKT